MEGGRAARMDLDSLDLKKLRAFHLVAKHGNLRLAAARLGQTIPAVSAKLRRLEEDLHLALFERLPNKLVLTAVGQNFLRDVEAIFDQAERALSSVAASTSYTGRLSVSIGNGQSWYFAPRLSKFLEAFPNVDLNLNVYRAPDALRALKAAELDLSIGIFPNPPKSLQSHVVVESPLSLVCPADHPLLRKQPLKVVDILSHRLIVLSGYKETRRLVDTAIAKTKMRPKRLIEVPNCATALTFVESGIGVAIVHSLWINQANSRKVRWIDLGQQFGKVSYRILYRKTSLSSPALRSLLDHLVS